MKRKTLFQKQNNLSRAKITHTSNLITLLFICFSLFWINSVELRCVSGLLRFARNDEQNKEQKIRVNSCNSWTVSIF
jgi:hypothetical protein